MNRLPKMANFNIEKDLIYKGFENICGLDEVGRGAWAGPLVSAAVILRKKIKGVCDSKLLSAKNREKLSLKIKQNAVWAVGEVSERELEKLKMTKGTELSFKRAVRNLAQKPDFVISDGFKFHSPLPCLAVIKGDRISQSIAAASIIAKVHRDELMKKMDEKFPKYHFGLHKGYGTKLHIKALKKHGKCRIHRKIFQPIKMVTKSPD